MPIYRMEIAGRKKSVLLKAESAAKAKDDIVKATALNAEQLGDALAAGEKVWNASDPLPADEEAAPEPETKTE